MPIRASCCSCWLALVLFAAAGCAASSSYMTEAQSLPLVAPSGKALLVFMRPSSLGFAVKFTVLDSQGRYFGDALAGGYYAIPIEPGPIAVYASGENDSALKGTVAAGNVYYVLVDPNMGVFSARVDLLAVKPGTEQWEERKEWLRDSTPFRVNLAAGQSSLQKEEVKKRLADGESAWNDYDAEDREEHTLAIADCDCAGPKPIAPPPATAPVAASEPRVAPLPVLEETAAANTR
jgi:hypothetical protein